MVDDLDDLMEEAIARRAGDFQRALLGFLTAFDLVFGYDWDFTRSILQSDGLEWYIRDGHCFLEPGVKDESDNWANRGGLLATYRQLTAVMRQMGLRTNCYPDD